MELYSLCFVLLLLVSLILYYQWGGRSREQRVQWGILLGTSLLFYLSQGPKKLVFILTTSVIVFLGARGIAYIEDRSVDKELSREEKKAIKKRKKKQERVILLCVLLLSLLLLSYVKYFNLIIKCFSEITNREFRPHSIIFPLGISFYTFQSLSYILDVYNKKSKPEKSYLKFLLFISWFPQLLQGPINRYDSLSAELFSKHEFNHKQFQKALLLILYGMVKKYALADMLIDLNNALIASVSSITPGFVSVVSMVVYTFWQYADFSGGIDMVMGISNLYGIDMLPNFRQPFFAQSVAEFWRRWHITLGSWMRDYVFYPLAVSKPVLSMSKYASKKISVYAGRIAPAVVSNVIVFLLVGLWHGATANYIAWGLYNGVVISLGEILRPVNDRIKNKLHLGKSVSYCYNVVATFILVMIGNAIECRENLGLSVTALWKIITDFDIKASLLCIKPIFADNVTFTSVLLTVCSFSIMFFVDICHEKKISLSEQLAKQNIFIRWLTYLVLILLVMLSFTRVTNGGGFAYANF